MANDAFIVGRARTSTGSLGGDLFTILAPYMGENGLVASAPLRIQEGRQRRANVSPVLKAYQPVAT
jgi:hypothetical protein